MQSLRSPPLARHPLQLLLQWPCVTEPLLCLSLSRLPVALQRVGRGAGGPGLWQASGEVMVRAKGGLTTREATRRVEDVEL